MPVTTGSAEEIARSKEELLKLVDDLLAGRVSRAEAKVILKAHQSILGQIELDTDTRRPQLIQELIKLKMER
jgi:hypothetical protein